jgi:hypothetical protein
MQVKLTKISYIRTLFNVQFIEDSVLIWVQFLIGLVWFYGV